MAEDARATFAVELEDETSGAATSAAEACAKLKEKIDADTAALRQMQAAMRNLKSATNVSASAVSELKDRIDAQKATIGAAQAKYLQLGGTFEKVSTQGSTSMGKLLGATKKLPGPLGMVANAVEDLGDLLSGGGAAAAGMVLIAAASLILVAGLVAGAVALGRYALAQADASRSELLRLESITSLDEAVGASTARAESMAKAISRVSDTVALSRSEIEGLSSSLFRAGLRGAELDHALEGMAITQSVQGSDAAKSFQRQAVAAARAGRSVRALSDDVRTRLGGIARRQMLSLDVQSRKLSEHLSSIFADLPIEKLLEGLHSVVELFSQSTTTGRALKTIVESIFGPLLEDVDAITPIVKRFFQGMVRAALLGGIAIYRVRNALRDTFGGVQFLEGIDAMKVALYGGMLVMSLLAGAAITLAIAIGLVLIGVLLLLAPFILVGYAVYKLVEAFTELYDWLSAINWSGLGESLINGLVRGIESGREAVMSAVRGVADAATGALSDALGIASPSRVFAELGRQVPRGFAVGVEAEAAIAGDAVADMAPASGLAIGGAGGAVTVSVGDIHVHVGSGNPDEIVEAIDDKIAALFERLGIELGGATT